MLTTARDNRVIMLFTVIQNCMDNVYGHGEI